MLNRGVLPVFADLCQHVALITGLTCHLHDPVLPLGFASASAEALHVQSVLDLGAFSSLANPFNVSLLWSLLWSPCPGHARYTLGLLVFMVWITCLLPFPWDSPWLCCASVKESVASLSP